jgi:hypothetical protein
MYWNLKLFRNAKSVLRGIDSDKIEILISRKTTWKLFLRNKNCLKYHNIILSTNYRKKKKSCSIPYKYVEPPTNLIVASQTLILNIRHCNCCEYEGCMILSLIINSWKFCTLWLVSIKCFQIFVLTTNIWVS